tara:strand:+ start:501 stop:1148 length:648 start_codon:yes stop_codon:yes gene_type:complete
MNFEVLDFPCKHGYSDSFISEDVAQKMESDFPSWDSDAWDKYGTVFESEYGYKKELNDKAGMPESISNFIKDLESDEFVSRLISATGIEDLFIDDGMYGGGLNIYPPGSQLTTHIDFNYNNDIQAYRAVNLLYYLNSDWDESGGCFEFYDTNLKKQRVITPKLNTCMFFVTNNSSYHGVSRTSDKFYRKSIAIWYYTKEPPPNLSVEPHRTLWVK